MNDHTVSIAQRLTVLPAGDRDWILAQLSDTERNLMLALLGDAPASATKYGATATHGEVSAFQQTRNPARAAADTNQELETATDQEMRELLASESDWLHAVLLTAREWSWGRAFLEATEPARLRKLRELVPRIENRVRPAVKHAVAALVNERLREHRQCVERPSFEAMLQEIEQEHELPKTHMGNEP